MIKEREYLKHKLFSLTSEYDTISHNIYWYWIKKYKDQILKKEKLYSVQIIEYDLIPGNAILVTTDKYRYCSPFVLFEIKRNEHDMHIDRFYLKSNIKKTLLVS